jgi:hypothetical protein
MSQSDDNTEQQLPPAESVQEPEGLQKKPSELTDIELEHLCNEIEAIIDKLRFIDLHRLTPEQQQKRQATLQQALGMAEILELEQMARLVRNVQASIGYRLALSQQKRKTQ